MHSFFSLDEVSKRRSATDQEYREFLRTATMSCGLYLLAAGAVDHQKPHEQDELYYVVKGRACFMMREDDGNQNDREVAPGDIIFVKARQEHRFHKIIQDLVVLVVFAPPET